MFAAEILLGGVLPLVLLSRKSLRERPDVLCVASLLAVVGVAYNRMNVVMFAMTFRGRMPWGAPETLCAVDRRVGRFGRPDRRDDLPLRARRPDDAGALQGEPRAGQADDAGRWLRRTRTSGRSPTLRAGRAAAAGSKSRRPHSRWDVHRRTFSPACRCSSAEPRSTSSRRPQAAGCSNDSRPKRRRRARGRHRALETELRGLRRLRAVSWISARRRGALRPPPGLFRYLVGGPRCALPPPVIHRVRCLARSGAVASPVLPDLRIAARDGPAGGDDPGRMRLLACGCAARAGNSSAPAARSARWTRSVSRP